MVRMPIDFIKRIATGLLPVAALSVLLLVSLYLMSEATDNSTKFDAQYATLLIINVVGLVLLVLLITANLYRLIRQYRTHVPGSRLTARMLTMFLIIAVVPVSVVYYFSLDILNRGIDSWFDVRVEKALGDALELSRSALDSRMRETLKLTDSMVLDLADTSAGEAALILSDLRIRSGASELTLFANAEIIASSGLDIAIINPNRPGEAILSYLRQHGSYVGLDPIPGSGLHIRVLRQVPTSDPVLTTRVLQGLFPVAERHNELADSVQSAFAKYDELVYLRKPLKFSFTLTLSLVLLLTLLTAVWAAFFSAQRLVAPITELAEGTRAVAAGDYGTRLPVSASDELGFLVQSFNDMTRRIERARDDVRHSQQQAEAERTYLEVVLGRLSSGVLALDERQQLRTVNAAADQILGVELQGFIGRPLAEICEEHPHVRSLVQLIEEHVRSDHEWREQATLFGAGGRQVLMCRGAALPDSDGVPAGDVVVFDDVTTLIQAQRDAAWGEVARRLAHEIKNPLTPIQLSAERMRRKYLAAMDPADAEVLDRSTHTIVQQVEHLKEMVNAFSEYARMPQVQLAPLDLNAVINEVLDLYRGTGRGLSFALDLDSDLPVVEADVGRLRQVLHNLIKNALEAMEGGKGKLFISTRCMTEFNCRFVDLRIRDTGPGIPEDILERLFEPYVTTKPKGTGLGLAIVKKIIEEHGGVLWAENLAEGGAQVVIRLPVADAKSAGNSHARELAARRGRARSASNASDAAA